MNLFKEILSNALSKYDLTIRFENLKTENPYEIVEMVCYGAILRIHAILDDAALDDSECVERIVSLLEEIGTGGGSRHDY